MENHVLRIEIFSLVASIVASIAALWLAWYGIRRANRTSSAATLVTLNESFRQGWIRYLEASDQAKKNYQLAELLNLHEIACAVFLENSLTGNSKKLMGDYLNRAIKIIKDNKEAYDYVKAELVQSTSTFEFIRKFEEKTGGQLGVAKRNK
jgi:hypothetical protein